MGNFVFPFADGLTADAQSGTQLLLRNIQLFSIVELAMILTGETRLKVKIFDFEHENDLEKAINEFIKSKKIIDIKYQISHFYAGNEQIYSFSALIMYENDQIYEK